MAKAQIAIVTDSDRSHEAGASRRQGTTRHDARGGNRGRPTERGGHGALGAPERSSAGAFIPTRDRPDASDTGPRDRRDGHVDERRSRGASPCEQCCVYQSGLLERAEIVSVPAWQPRRRCPRTYRETPSDSESACMHPAGSAWHELDLRQPRAARRRCGRAPVGEAQLRHG